MEELIVHKKLIRTVARNRQLFLSLTDMAKIRKGATGVTIANWFNTKKTINFLEAWEEEHNPFSFKVMKSHHIKTKIGKAPRRARISIRKWIQATNAKGLETETGRYGGTWADLEIANEFATWLAPGFKIKLNAEVHDQAEWERRADWVRAQYTPFDSMF